MGTRKPKPKPSRNNATTRLSGRRGYIKVTCPTCRGKGEYHYRECGLCKGSGKIWCLK